MPTFKRERMSHIKNADPIAESAFPLHGFFQKQLLRITTFKNETIFRDAVLQRPVLSRLDGDGHRAGTCLEFFHAPSSDMSRPMGFHLDDMFPRGKIHGRDAQRIEKGLCMKAIDVKDRIDAGIVHISCMALVKQDDSGVLIGCFQPSHFLFLSGKNHPDAAHGEKKSRDSQYIK